MVKHFILIFCFLFSNLNAEQVKHGNDIKNLEKIQKNMSIKQVEALLGSGFRLNFIPNVVFFFFSIHEENLISDKISNAKILIIVLDEDEIIKDFEIVDYKNYNPDKYRSKLEIDKHEFAEIFKLSNFGGIKLR